MIASLVALALLQTAFPLDPSTFPSLGPDSGVGNFAVGPSYAAAPELSAREDVPKGTIHTFTMRSAESHFYPGIAKNRTGTAPYERKVTVYVPDGYAAGTQAPFLVAQDSMASSILPTILDNMIADHRLPALVAIFVDNGGGDAQGSERGLEYDTVSGRYADFIEREVLPRVKAECGVDLTRDPDGRMTMGCSSGAAAALSMAWFRPNLYHRVLSYSGTFVNQQWPPNPRSPHGAWEFHEHWIPQMRRKPIRIWMEVGELDIRYGDPESTYHNWVLANERTASALASRGYEYQFVFAHGAHHCDWRVVQQTLPEALAWAWRGYRASS